MVGLLISAPVLLFGFLGLFMAWDSMKNETALFLMMFIAFTFLHAVFISKVRLRLPLDHFTVIFAAHALRRAFLFIRKMGNVIIGFMPQKRLLEMENQETPQSLVRWA